MTSLLPLPLNFPFRRKRLHSLPYKPFSCSPLPSTPFLCFSSPSNFDREEVRWLREEQRWLREEQRWLREEQRWLRERESLLQEISALKLQMQSLEDRNPTQGASVSETIANIGAPLQVLKEKNLIAESGTSAGEMVLEEKSEEVNEVVVEEQGIRVLERERRQDGDKMKSKVLRKGSEGDDVRELQEALGKLGFYSGDEDMEYSSFSDGTERAVKTWQATIGSPENGIMTAELLERLYMEQRIQGSSSNSNADKKGASLTVPQKDETNGAAVASITEISEIQQKVFEEGGITEVEVSQQRVFLLGENRWEEPSRLIGRDKQVTASKTREATTKCLTCRGEGRLMCTECDGTGEPNIEPQFLEWVDEGAKCPYCEGLGYITCDVCEGKMVA